LLTQSQAASEGRIKNKTLIGRLQEETAAGVVFFKIRRFHIFGFCFNVVQAFTVAIVFLYFYLSFLFL